MSNKEGQLNLFNEDINEEIRCYINDQGIYMFSVYDFMNIACGKSTSDKYAQKTFTREKFRQNVGTYVMYIFSGQGQRETPCMNLSNLQQLLMLLPGDKGKQYRQLAEHTVTRVLAGDLTLINEIEENHVSTELISDIARSVLDIHPLSTKVDKLSIKVRDMKLLIKQKDLIIEENRLALREKDIKLEVKDKIITQMSDSIDTLSSSNKILVKTNDKIKTTNSKLIQNFAIIPESNLLVEYLVIIRKYKHNYHYEEIVYEEEEDLQEDIDNEIRKQIEKEKQAKLLQRIITTYCKHYIIRCQYRAIHKQIKNLKDNYDLDNIDIIHCERNPNPGTLTHVLKQQEFIKFNFGNHLQIIDEISLINYIRNYVSKEIPN